MINPRLLTSRARHKICPFIKNVETASTNVIYFITWSYFKNLYFSERKTTGGMIPRTPLWCRNDKRTSETVVRHSNHSKLHSLKTQEKKVSFKLVLLTPPPPPPFIVIQCWENRLGQKTIIKYAVDFIKSWFHLQLSGKKLFTACMGKSQPFNLDDKFSKELVKDFHGTWALNTSF